MAKKEKPLPPSPPTNDEIDDAVGLFLMAFGQGVSPQHVRHEVVRTIIDTFRVSLRAAFNDPAVTDWRKSWKMDAASVLSMMTAVGRMSGQIAMTGKLLKKHGKGAFARRSVVNLSDFNEAMNAIKIEHDFEGARASLGKYCQF